MSRRTGQRIMYIQRRHWLDYDPVALAALVFAGTCRYLSVLKHEPDYLMKSSNALHLCKFHVEPLTPQVH